MATTKTRAQLVAMALDNLMAVGSGQDAEAEDYDKVDGRLDGLIAELGTREVCDVSDDSEIPIEWTDALAILLADAAAPAFGIPKMAEQARDSVMDRLKVITMRRDAPNRTLRVDTALQGVDGHLTYARWLNGG